MAFVVQPLAGGHDRSAFTCGEPALDEYLRRYAGQSERTGIGRTFVAVPESERRVVGFYTLTAGSVAFESLPDAGARLPRYAVPVAHVARLGVCRSVQGGGLGGALLVDALGRVAHAAESLGIHAVEVRAKSEAARRFYERFELVSLKDDPLHLYLPLATVREMLR